MKLRIRALNSEETLRIDIPGDSSLQQLRQAIANAVPLSSSALRLSLNRSDELSAESESLLSLGIASGDLIFYSLSVSDHQQNSPPTNQCTSVEPHSEAPVSAATDCDPMQGEGFVGESMEIDEESGRFHESCFARRLIRVLGEGEEFGNEGFDRKSIVAAVDCVLLESGFVRFDSVSGNKIEDELRLPSSMAFSVCLNYTLPAILEKNERQSVVLKFQTLKHFVNVFASLTNGKSGSATYRLCLDQRRLANESENELLELWKSVRDGLALPLMIDLCAKAGLPGPVCFSQLPAELMAKILENLPGDDVGRAGCVCKELSDLSSNNSLWMQKFTEEFGLERMLRWRRRRPTRSWKTAFVRCQQRRRREEEQMRQSREEEEQVRQKWEEEEAIRMWESQMYLLDFIFSVPCHGICGICCGCYNQMPGLIAPPDWGAFHQPMEISGYGF